MSNKIFQELCRIAKEILENSDESNFQKVYDQTLSLLEQLILIKNSEGFSEDFWLELKSKYNMEIDFIHANEKGVIDEDFSDSLSQSRNSTIETNKETSHTKNYEAEIEISSNLDLVNKIKEGSTPQKEVIKERLNDRFSKGLKSIQMIVWHLLNIYLIKIQMTIREQSPKFLLFKIGIKQKRLF